MSKLLIVDDEEKIVDVLKEYAIFNNFEVDCAYDGQQAVDLALNNDYDCIIMDIMMPNLNGYDAVKQIRAEKNIPVVMVSAKSEEYDKLLGFELGIDDYIVKPFSPKEVMARIKAIIKRSLNTSNKIATKNLFIDLTEREVLLNGKQIQLTSKEFDLLVFLIKHQPEPQPREKILNEVWGNDYFGDGRTVDTHIKMLRAHLGNDAKNIKTIHGLGYKFEEQ